MEKTTKERILDSALDLFSINGYEATTVDEIAKAVGIKAPSLYKHYKNKQAIFDGLVELVSDMYDKNSIFSKKQGFKMEYFDMDKIIENVLFQIEFSLTNPYVSKFRKLLTIEQFRNDEMKIMQSEKSYFNLLDYYEALFKCLIEKKAIKDLNPKILAIEYASPISMVLFECDRNISYLEEGKNLIKEHVIKFFNDNRRV